MDGINISAESIIKIEKIKEEPLEYQEEYTWESTEEQFQRDSSVQCPLKMEHDAEGVKQDPGDCMVEQLEDFTDPSVMCVGNFDGAGAWSSDGECGEAAFVNDVASRMGSSFETWVSASDGVQQHPALRHFQPPYECVACRKSYKSKRALLQHRLQSHGGDPLPLVQCPACPRSFVGISYLVAHMKVHGGRRHKCPVCHKSFKLKSTVAKHKRMHKRMHMHGSGRRHECPACLTTFADGSTLRRHVRCCPERQARALAGRERARRHACAVCQRSFRLQSTLVRHRQIHRCDATHRCSVCAQSFGARRDLVKHMDSHKPVTYDCSVCQQTFESRRNLLEHVNSHKPVTYDCSVCQQSFQSRSNLVKHMNIHNRPPYECSVCQRVWKSRSNFIKHKLTHNFERRLPKENCS